MRVRIPAPSRGSPRPTRRAAFVIGLLFATVVAVLLFESSVLDLSQDLPRHYFPLTSSAGDDPRLLHDELTAAVLSSSVEIPKDLELEVWIHESDPVGEVPSDELLHLSLLQAACLANSEGIVPWMFGAPGANQQSEVVNKNVLISRDDPELLEKLRQCPDVDIFLPTGIRGHGYCEDATVYAKFLKSRLLPMWAIETPLFDSELNRTVTYHELCPRTPILLFNHYWDDVPYSPKFPKDKPVYLMPNVEMYELNEKYLWRVDVILCKTHICYDRITQWYKQEGNPRNAKVVYTRHTSSDVANFAKTRLGTDTIAPKDFVNPRFIHAVGGSAHKGTNHVLDCWLSRPDFPRLDLFIHEGNYKAGYEARYGERIRASQVNLTSHNLDSIAFGRVVAEGSFFLCPSRMEGYGHYINQARASGAVIVTTNASPMNELIQSSDMGVYVDTQLHKDSNMFLGGAHRSPHGLKDVDGMLAVVTGDDICKAVEQVVYNMTVWKRQAIAAKAKQQYHADTKFFARKMLQLRHFAAQGSRKGTSISAVSGEAGAAAKQLRGEEGASS